MHLCACVCVCVCVEVEEVNIQGRKISYFSCLKKDIVLLLFKKRYRTSLV